jgi:hypothetical protein
MIKFDNTLGQIFQKAVLKNFEGKSGSTLERLS